MRRQKRWRLATENPVPISVQSKCFAGSRYHHLKISTPVERVVAHHGRLFSRIEMDEISCDEPTSER
jgi:hypothetical protein